MDVGGAEDEEGGVGGLDLEGWGGGGGFGG